MQYQPLPYTIVASDVAGSGAYDDREQLSMRAKLQTIFSEALQRIGVDTTAMDRNDLGDGIRLIVDARVSPRMLLDPFIPSLASAVHQHRNMAGSAPVRLRVAAHMGLLHRDATGWAGEPLVHCARLLDAQPVRRVLVEADRADLVLVVSQAMYDAVVVHGYGLDRSSYHPVRITAKETTTVAWVHVPGYQTPPGVNGVTVDRTAVRDTGPVKGYAHPLAWRRFAGVVDALLEVPEFAGPQSREVVLAQLRSEVLSAIPRHPSSKVDAFSIVRTCMRYPGALRDLVESVRLFAGNSIAMARLDAEAEDLL